MFACAGPLKVDLAQRSEKDILFKNPSVKPGETRYPNPQ